MTLAPLVSPEVRGIKGPPYAVGDKCVVPGCLSNTQQRHHAWPRSYLRGQPVEWVQVGELTLKNAWGVCTRHHNWVTGVVGGGHLAKIILNEGLGVLEWWEKEGDRWVGRGPLRGQVHEHAPVEAARVRREEGLCPTCGRLQPREKVKPAFPPRKVKTWTIVVPDDSEVGAEVLDVYIEDLAVLMGFNDSSTRLLRYHVLVPSLEWISQNKVEFIRDWEEDGLGTEPESGGTEITLSGSG